VVETAAPRLVVGVFTIGGFLNSKHSRANTTMGGRIYSRKRSSTSRRDWFGSRLRASISNHIFHSRIPSSHNMFRVTRPGGPHSRTHTVSLRLTFTFKKPSIKLKLMHSIPFSMPQIRVWLATYDLYTP
jgi:hypothetical protein